VARTLSGPPGTVQVAADLDGLADAFARVVVQAFATRPGPRFTFVASGGPTAGRCYERLAVVGGPVVNWSAVDVYMGDERCVPPDDPDANQRLVREALLDRIPAVGSFHTMSCDEGPDAYERELAAVAAFDVAHLGMGPDGHTASLFPDAPTLHAPPERLVVLSRDPHDRNPHSRMSLTLAALTRARLAVFTVSGEAKRDAFAAVCSGADVPAARVRAESVLWLVDRAAAGSALEARR
jgi:6-phosphogluconolactonase